MPLVTRSNSARKSTNYAGKCANQINCNAREKKLQCLCEEERPVHDYLRTHGTFCWVVSWTLPVVCEMPTEILTHTPVVQSTASGPQMRSCFEVWKGSRQSTSQMLGGGSALRTGRKARCSEDMTGQALLEDFWMGTGSHLGEDHLVK